MTDTDTSVGDPSVVRSTPRRVTAPSKRRRHPAVGARIVAAGFGASTMFGLVAAMGIAHVRAETTPSSTDEMFTVVPAPTGALTIVPLPDLVAAEAIPLAAPIAAPIVLQARPDVRVVASSANVAAPAAAPAPVATTRGSN